MLTVKDQGLNQNEIRAGKEKVLGKLLGAWTHKIEGGRQSHAEIVYLGTYVACTRRHAR